MLEHMYDSRKLETYRLKIGRGRPPESYKEDSRFEADALEHNPTSGLGYPKRRRTRAQAIRTAVRELPYLRK